MLRICPDALLLNYANPMAINCWATDLLGVRIVGLCHSVQGTSSCWRASWASRTTRSRSRAPASTTPRGSRSSAAATRT